jgi:hypothetical protein
MSAYLNPLSRKFLSDDLIAREVGRDLLYQCCLASPSADREVRCRFLAGGIVHVNRHLADCIQGLGGMAGEW